MKYQVTFFYYTDPNKLTHLRTIEAKNYGEAYSKFFNDIHEEVFMLAITEETKIE